jgi:hypothetical protein
MDILIKIKRLVISRRIVFTSKAVDERAASGLTSEDVYEAILNAVSINKVLRSTSTLRSRRGEKLFVIIGATYDGRMVYTKGTIRRDAGVEEFYVLVSSKWSAYD